jgi:hypothetical protein
MFCLGDDEGEDAKSLLAFHHYNEIAEEINL